LKGLLGKRIVYPRTPTTGQDHQDYGEDLGMARTQGYASRLGKAPTTLYYLKKLVVRWKKSPPHPTPMDCDDAKRGLKGEMA
jgi:hypothetical protein